MKMPWCLSLNVTHRGGALSDCDSIKKNMAQRCV